jgi:hypothetical protein
MPKSPAAWADIEAPSGANVAAITATKADEIEPALVHSFVPVYITIGKDKRGRSMSFSLEPKEVKTCFCIEFSLGVKSIDFNYRYFENQECFCPVTRTADHHFPGFAYCSMNMQLWFPFVTVDGSHSKYFARAVKASKFADHFWLFLLRTDDDIGLSETARNENRRRFDIFGNRNFMDRFVKVFAFE